MRPSPHYSSKPNPDSSDPRCDGRLLAALAALKHLASLDPDHARSLNQAGFGASDVSLGHRLARMSADAVRRSPALRNEVLRLAGKYRRQVPGGLAYLTRCRCYNAFLPPPPPALVPRRTASEPGLTQGSGETWLSGRNRRQGSHSIPARRRRVAAARLTIALHRHTHAHGRGRPRHPAGCQRKDSACQPSTSSESGWAATRQATTRNGCPKDSLTDALLAAPLARRMRPPERR